MSHYSLKTAVNRIHDMQSGWCLLLISKHLRTIYFTNNLIKTEKM